MTGRRIHLAVTPAQLRLMNSALALYEAEIDGGNPLGCSRNLVDRTRLAVHEAMEREGVDYG